MAIFLKSQHFRSLKVAIGYKINNQVKKNGMADRLGIAYFNFQDGCQNGRLLEKKFQNYPILNFFFLILQKI